RFKVEADEQLVAAKGAWKTVGSDALVGTWDWVLPTTPPQPMNWSMTLAATKDPFVYKAALTLTGDDGKPKAVDAVMVVQTDHQPFFRLVMPVPGGPPAAMIGPMVWAPDNGTPRILTRNISFDRNITWVKKGGTPPGPGPAPLPDGWVTVTDANRMVSLAMPPTFVAQPALAQQVRQLLPGYDLSALDPNLMAGVEIVRFDGLNDPAQVFRIMVTASQRMGNQIQAGPPQQSVIGGVRCLSYPGQIANNTGLFNLGMNLIPTPRGIVAVNFVTSVRTVQESNPILMKISQTIQVAR
ncbi:MAG: hypothetical protein JWO31_832, partial [Phycisphaerales bacterium]|nr:hypothetical protein [Phycisphaerales bacterium]